MKKALLVDDDFLVRTYLKTLNSWEKAGFEICGDVRDGEEALTVLEKEAADLVVTDIAMPLMDGIQLIREIRKRYKGTHIIVLSCHDDFSSVKEAMKEGADEYVLKNTLDEDSLYSVLENASLQMQSKVPTETDEIMQLKPVSDENRLMYFNQVIAGMLSETEREAARKKAGIHGEYQNSGVIVIKDLQYKLTDDPFEGPMQEQNCRDFAKKMQEGLQTLLPEDAVEREIVYLGGGIFCCFIDLSGISKSSEMHQNITSAVSACYRLVREAENRYAIGVSEVCIGSEALRQGYQQARQAVKQCFYETDKIAYYENGKGVSEDLPTEAEQFMNRIDTIRVRNDRQEFEKQAKKVISAFRKARTEERTVVQWIENIAAESNADRRKLPQVVSIDDAEAALSYIEKHILRLKSDGADMENKHISQPVRVAAEYIQKHFKEPIGLSDAAEAAGVNTTYLSYIFGQEMGVGFSAYILELRMDHARRLLSETTLKMREVAEESGFHDYHYFSKVFKKMNGVSPADYRKGSR